MNESLLQDESGLQLCPVAICLGAGLLSKGAFIEIFRSDKNRQSIIIHADNINIEHTLLRTSYCTECSPSNEQSW